MNRRYTSPVRAPTVRLLQGFSNTSFAGDTIDRKSTTGVLLTYNAAPVSCNSKNQDLLSLSTSEAEYIALIATIQAVPAIKRTLFELTITADDSVAVHTDNQAAQDIFSKQFGTKLRNFIGLKHHFLQDRIKNSRFHIHHVPAKRQKADMLTKPLKLILFNDQSKVIGMSDPEGWVGTVPTRGCGSIYIL